MCDQEFRTKGGALVFKIGEFSKLTRVSPRMLRHYEKCGLLYPAEIDKFTGYRQYSAKQILLLTKIVTLRDMGFSIDEITETLPRYDDRAFLQKALRAKAASVQSGIAAQQEKLERLLLLCDTIREERNNMVHEVELRALPAVKALTFRGIIPHYSDEGMLWERLGRFVAEHRIACHKDGYSTYFDEEYKESDPDVEIAIPVDALSESREGFVFKEYDGIPLAATVRFSGPFDGGYDAASEKLAAWMEQNGYAFAGNLRGHVITSPDEEANPENWQTELQAPVMKK